MHCVTAGIPKKAEFVSTVFELSTSSPMTRHPAVLILLLDKDVIAAIFLVKGY